MMSSWKDLLRLYKQTLATELASYINEYRWTETEVLEHGHQLPDQHHTDFSQYRLHLLGRGGDFSQATDLWNRTKPHPLTDWAWQFSYPEGRSLVHDELTFEALTGFIDYYAYLMLGYDFDSFAELGAVIILKHRMWWLAQSSNAIGWTDLRTTGETGLLMADMMNSSYDDLRRAYYKYHREALTALRNPDQAREAALEALELIQTTKRRSTSNFLFDLFFDAKSREIAAMLADAKSQIKLEAYTILSETDRAHLAIMRICSIFDSPFCIFQKVQLTSPKIRLFESEKRFFTEPSDD